MREVTEQLREQMMRLSISPVYFVGSGLSRRYFGAPDYKTLLKEVVPDHQKVFLKLTQRWGDNYPAIAQNLAEYYFDLIDNENLKEGARWDRYFKDKIVEIIQNKYFLARDTNFLEKHEIEWMQKTTPSAIITTNYDTFLEDLFDYDPVIGQDNILSTQLSAVGEIYKIHGCVTRPESIVVMQEDYDEFMKRKLYLNSKLMTLFLEYPIIFLGYSLADTNVRSVLSDIVNILQPSQVDALTSRIFFVKRNEKSKDFIQRERFELENGKSLYLDVYYLNDFSVLFKSLIDEEAQKLPVRFLRFLKNNMYKLTSGQINDPKLLRVSLEDLKGINDFSKLNIIGLTFNTEVQRVQLMMSDIVEYFIYDKDPNPRATVTFLIMESKNKHVPIHFIKRTLGDIDTCTRYVQSIEGLSEADKDKFIEKLKVKREIKGLKSFGKVEYKFDISEVRNLSLFIDDLLFYANEYCEEHNVQVNSSFVVLRWLLLAILKERIDEILDDEVFLQTHKEELLSCVLKLDKSFIQQYKESLFKMMIKFDDKNHSLDFRNALCYLDRELYF